MPLCEFIAVANFPCKEIYLQRDIFNKKNNRYE